MQDNLSHWGCNSDWESARLKIVMPWDSEGTDPQSTNSNPTRPIFDLSGIEFSRFDKRRGINLPNYLTEDLAELIGFHVGDGYATISKRPKGNITDYIVWYEGNPRTEIEYYDNFLQNIILKLFKISVPAMYFSKGKMYGIRINSKAIVNFYSKVLGIPLGKKSQSVTIPKIILESNLRIKAAFLRGLFDADGCITFKGKYKNPSIQISLASKELVIESAEILRKDFEFTVCVCDTSKFDKRTNKTYAQLGLYISGKKQLPKWLKIIGTRKEHYYSSRWPDVWKYYSEQNFI